MLQLLLFIDDRPITRDLIKELEEFLHHNLPNQSRLQVINVSSQPYLAEHFKVIMTPALLKINPSPRQVIAGKNLISQLADCWKDWQNQAITNEDKPLDQLDIPYSSELIRLADEMFRLSQEKAILEEELRFKERIIAILAHDLRSPLTAISLALETIELNHEQLTSDLAMQLFKHARNQTKALDIMITDILEASQGSTSELKIYLQKIQIGELCKSVVSDYSLISRLQAKQQALVTDIPTDLPLVYADPERVRQVLINLIGNAIKYTPIGGEITVAVLHRTSQKVEITVTDNGLGIPMKLRDRIFEDRFRVQENDEQEGYGIGLAVCQRIIRAHYGRIWVDSAGKQGSSFHFTLPVY
ncbi:histidine kinase,KaiB domain-containing protein,histidine kinase [Synechococcus sp. PCC 7502]|uniref:histidine kinase n=1 Tax=Synechococcus sp. PCC 7502 TaxID=1173263 RepID=UPI00029F9C6D|nr:histidine kinase [Synechococcus sp. PCC 7502]AFY73204.1 histidine kinase,KaiB domain-containing protein,histidine kinase [Synechococcus sp. PCC 7502]